MNSSPSNAPRRVMGFRDLLLFYVVTGISLRWIATAATLGASAIAIWLFAWFAFYIPLALTVMELSSRYPEEGGLYLWSKRAFGEFSGFTTGWTYWASNLPYFPAILYFAAGSALYIQPGRWLHLSGNKEYFLIFSLVGLAVATFSERGGIASGEMAAQPGRARDVASGGDAVRDWHHRVGEVWLGDGVHMHSMRPSVHLRDVLFWSTIVFALAGSESASFLGDEVKDPRRNIPRALLLAGIIVTTAYILGTVCVLVALPQSEVSGLEGIMQAITRSAGRVGWIGIGPLAAILITVSNIGTVGAWLAVSARIPFVAGMDRYIPAVFGRLHPRWGTPYVAILMQAGLSVLFIFLSQAGTSVGGAYDVMVSMCIISYFIPYLFTFAALIRLQRAPAGPEVRRIPGGKAGSHGAGRDRIYNLHCWDYCFGLSYRG
jgi:amino acid transporter